MGDDEGIIGGMGKIKVVGRIMYTFLHPQLSRRHLLLLRLARGSLILLLLLLHTPYLQHLGRELWFALVGAKLG